MVYALTCVIEMAPGGRKPQPLAERTARRLHRLYERKQSSEVARRRAFDEFVLAILDAAEQEGASVREIGKALGCPHNTVQGWVEKARQIRRERLE
jgi:transposase-like protein